VQGTFFEETKRRRVCQETNNNELSRGNSEAEGYDNENFPTNNDDQSGAMVLAGIRCNDSNISETTHVPISSAQKQRNNSTVEEPSHNQTLDERVTYDDGISSSYALLMERYNSLKEENRLLLTRVNTLENSIENNNLTARIGDLEKKVEQLCRSQPLSFGSISPSQCSDIQDFCNDNIIGTFDTFEHVQRKKTRTSNTHAIMLTRATKDRHAGLVNPDNLCYANVIYQAFASCKQFTRFSNDPPSQNHDDFPLCYEFTTLLNSMIE
jgi:hypothetical protein